MLRTCTSIPQMLHSFHRMLEDLNLSLCVDARASTSDASAAGDPISCAVAILVAESPPRCIAGIKPSACAPCC